MKKIFTLATLGLLSAASFQAQAQITVDGVVSAAEIGAANTGKYVLLSKFTNPRGFGDYGLLSVYTANTASKIYIFVAGTVENNAGGSKNAFQVYLDRPGVAGASASPTALPVMAASATSFGGMVAKLDIAPDLAIAIRGNGTAAQLQAEAISYTSATAATDRVLTAGGTPLADNGAALTVSATGSAAPLAALAGSRMAYKNSTDGKVLTNPGYNASTAAASYGAAGSFGWEIEIDRTAAGLGTNGAVYNLFVLQNSGDGSYLSSDFIPQATTPLTTNSGNPAQANGVDFATITGTQSAPITIATVTATKAADDASVAMSVYPNPAAGAATVAYRVLNGAENVKITLSDLSGRTVRTLADGVQTTGIKNVSVSTADVAGGTYMVRVQVGEKVAVRKVVLL